MSPDQFSLLRAVGEHARTYRDQRRPSGVDPLAPGLVEEWRDIEGSAVSTVYHTAPNTPNVVTFPRRLSRAAERGTTTEHRTPQLSFSSTTVVGSRKPSRAKDGVDLEDPGTTADVHHLPWMLTRTYTTVHALTLLGLVIVVAAVRIFLPRGLPIPAKFTTCRVLHYMATSAPVIVAMIAQESWTVVLGEVQQMQFLINLSRPGECGETAKRTIDLDYPHQNVFVCIYKSFRNRDWLVVLACFLSIFTFAFQSLLVSLFSVRSVWWLFPATNVTGLSQVGLNPPENWLDMNAFQGASGFATADVQWNIGYPPFVDSNGYTVEKFELPAVTNGTVYADLSGVHYQASCIGPTESPTIQGAGTIEVTNTVTFNGCQYSWSVFNASGYYFGVTSFPDNSSGCPDYRSTPLQYRPVVFYFFATEPSPSASAVLCRPSLSTSKVSVAVDLASETTIVLSGIDVTSPIVTDQSIYNGLFFDSNLLDDKAFIRLEGIHQQLPGAIFQAVQAQDPTLVNSFAHGGFTNTTSSIYNTYLSLVAQSIYFVDAQQPVTIRLGQWCDRIFLDTVFVVAVSICFSTVAAGGLILQCLHQHARKHVTLPRHYTTPRFSFRLTGDVVTQSRILAAERSTHAEKKLAELRLALCKETRQIVVVQPEGGRAPSPVPSTKERKESDQSQDDGPEPAQLGGWPSLTRMAVDLGDTSSALPPV